MKKLLIFLIIIISTKTFSNNNIRLELANLTVQYYKFLSNNDFDELINLVDNKFSVNGIINFNTRNDTLNFFKTIYGKSKQTIELSKISVLNYKEINNIKPRFINKVLHGKNVLQNNDWITFINKLRVNGKLTPSKIILIFKPYGRTWLVKAMYNKDL